MPAARDLKKYIKGEDKMGKLMGVSRQTVRNWIDQGKISYERVGRVKYFDPGQDPTKKLWEE